MRYACVYVYTHIYGRVPPKHIFKELYIEQHGGTGGKDVCVNPVILVALLRKKIRMS